MTTTRKQLDQEFDQLLAGDYTDAQEFDRSWNRHIDSLLELDSILAGSDYSPYSTINS